MNAVLSFFRLASLFFVLGSSLSAFDLKNPPLDGIYDPYKYLDTNFRTRIAHTINYERTHREFEIFLLLFDEEPSQGAEVLAKQAGENWSKGKYWTVVYQVGKDAEPNCVVGGDYMSRLPAGISNRTVRGARGTALLVATPLNRLQELINNLADEFGFLKLQAKQNYEKAVAEFDAKHRAEQRRKGTVKVIAGTALLTLLALATGAFFFWKKYLRKLKPLEFPLTSPRRRLSAPFSGGGDVLVSYGRKR